MEELLAGILGLIFEALAEFLVELLFELLVAALLRDISRVFRRFRLTLRRADPVIATLMFTLLGAAVGFLSVFVFPHPLVHPSKMHGISLLISPVGTGLVMALIGRTVRRRGRSSVQIESFGYGFTFALAMALVRFWLTS